MDNVARCNKARWEALALAGISYSRPWLDLTPKEARLRIDPQRSLGKLRGRNILCLAAGGGQQSAAFALLGAKVTVLDLSEHQLKKDRAAATHYGLEIRAVRGDMRDLSCLRKHAFDVVWQAHSLNFVPNALDVFEQVRSVIKPEGIYRIHLTNPFVFGVWLEKWDGNGYPLHRVYADGPFLRSDPHWYFDTGSGQAAKARAPLEFVHTISTVINGLVRTSFHICGLWEDKSGNPRAKAGSWKHFKAVAPPWLTIMAKYSPSSRTPRSNR